jgi:putative DNA primase/helicase
LAIKSFLLLFVALHSIYSRAPSIIYTRNPLDFWGQKIFFERGHFFDFQTFWSLNRNVGRAHDKFESMPGLALQRYLELKGVELMNLLISDQAISFVRAGFSVLPLQYPVEVESGLACSCSNRDCRSLAKHPVGRLVPEGLKDASRNEDVVATWFQGDRPWNIGIVTGQDSGLVVLDIDPRHGGDDSLAAIEKEHGPMPSTCRFSTGGGGTHILFQHPGCSVPNSAGKIGPGIDVRGDGGYIVAPPSRHISGARYFVSEGSISELAPLPEWLFAAITNTHPSKGQPTNWRQFSNSVPEGQRNVTLARLSGTLLGRGVEPHLCLDLLLAYNNSHCRPPLAAEEVATIVGSIARREFAKRGIGYESEKPLHD